MRLTLVLAFALAVCCAQTQAGTAPPPATSCASPPCNSTVGDVMVSIQIDAPKNVTTAPVQAIASAAHADDTPYVGWYQRSPVMRFFVWYCAVMFVVAIVGLTAWSMFDASKSTRYRDR